MDEEYWEEEEYWETPSGGGGGGGGGGAGAGPVVAQAYSGPSKDEAGSHRGSPAGLFKLSVGPGYL